MDSSAPSSMESTPAADICIGWTARRRVPIRPPGFNRTGFTALRKLSIRRLFVGLTNRGRASRYATLFFTNCTSGPTLTRGRSQLSFRTLIDWPTSE
jgi:hypothetical protein